MKIPYQGLVGTFKDPEKKVIDSRTSIIYKADFGHIKEKFVGRERSMGFERNYFSRNYDVIYSSYIYRFSYNSEFQGIDTPELTSF